MSILLDSIAAQKIGSDPAVQHQQTEPFCNGNTFGQSLRRDAASSAAPTSPFEFGFPSQVENPPNVFVFKSGVENVQSMLHKMRIRETEASSTRTSDFSGAFSVGSGGVPTSQTTPSQTVNPRPRFFKLRKSTHFAKGKSINLDTGVSSSIFNTPSPFDSKVSSPSTSNVYTGEPSFPSFGERTKDKNADITGEENANSSHTESSKTAEVGDGEDYNSFKRWFHAQRKNEADSNGGKVESHGKPGGTSSFTFTAMRDAVPVIPERERSDVHANSVAEELAGLKIEKDVKPAEPFNFTSESDVHANSVAEELGALKIEKDVKRAEPFIFTAGSEARKAPSSGSSEGLPTGVNEATHFPYGSEKTTNIGDEVLFRSGSETSGASNVSTGFFFTSGTGVSSDSHSSSSGFAFTSGTGATGGNVNAQPGFVFTSGKGVSENLQNPNRSAPEFVFPSGSGTANFAHTGFVFSSGSREAANGLFTGPETEGFAFKASGRPSISKKKKDKRRPSKHVPSTSAPSTDEQGSPMDVSPSAESGAATPTHTQQEAGNAQFQTHDDNTKDEDIRDVDIEGLEDLRSAAQDLNIGTEDAKNVHDTPKPETFAFTSSSSSPATSRRSRRILKGIKTKQGVNRTKPSTVKNDAYEMELDNSKKMPGIFSQPSTASTAPGAAAEQTCESWRLRGNQAYANGDFPKAEEYYSLGANSVPPNETSRSCIRASMLCYSNRAATRMVVGRMREALADCMRAMTVDPNFLRVRLRAGSCYLALGEFDSAVAYFKDCLSRARDHDRNDLKIVNEASEGLKKTQQAMECCKRVGDLLSRSDYTAALRLVNDALPTCPYSETLLESKARCLLSVRRFDEAIEMCDQTLALAESNWTVVQQANPRAWRLWVKAKALFYLGRLEESVECLRKLGENLALSGSDNISEVLEANLETFAQFDGLLHDLLRHKAAGNEAFQAGKHTEAVEHYTAALACNSDARPFNAVLFCNRAAASQALGHIADAIADSSRAVVLNPGYAKAISRRATLHALIRDYAQACIDLRRLSSLLEKQSKQGQDLKQARERLASAEEDAKKNHPLDHYLILGVEPSCTAVDIRKAYRKLALRHHPDKAGQLLTLADGDEDVSWYKEAGENIRHDAERLFKLIGEAYAILSDPSKRSRYDAEEELRKLRTRVSGTNVYNNRYYHSNTGRRQRDGYDPWTGYTHQYQRWQSSPDAAQPDTYARQYDYWDL